jgi:catechol 2,3-dioxygenase-like lactoylglutathione lyase family enzyme
MFSAPQVNVYTDHVERGIAFYQRFGFAETFRTPREGPPIHVELSLDGFILGVALRASLRTDHGIDIPPGQARGMELVLWTDDTDAAYADAVAAGATSLSEPHDLLGTLRMAWIADPDGNPIQLVQRR